LDLRLFRRPNLPAGNVLALLNLAVTCSLFFLPVAVPAAGHRVFPTEGRGNAAAADRAGPAVAPLAGWLVARTGARALIAGGTALTATRLALLVRIDVGWTSWQLLPGLLLAGLGVGGVDADHYRHAGARPGRAGRDRRRRPNAFRLVGLSLGVSVMGAIVAAQWHGDLARHVADPAAFTTGISAGFAVNAGVALATAVLCGPSDPHPSRTAARRRFTDAAAARSR
jgi:hypothetical protein